MSSKMVLEPYKEGCWVDCLFCILGCVGSDLHKLFLWGYASYIDMEGEPLE